MYKPFLGDSEMLVHWHVITVQVWSIKATRHMVLSPDQDGNLTTTTLHQEQHVLSNHTFNLRHEELISNDLQDPITLWDTQITPSPPWKYLKDGI